MVSRLAYWRVYCAAVSLFALVFLERAAAQDVSPSQAAQPSSTPQPQLAPQTTMTGDWGGLRTKLHDKGVDLNLGFKSEAMGNVYGGLPKGFTQSGQLVAGMTVDTNKLLGWQGGTWQTTLTEREGSLPPGTLLEQSEEVYGRGNILRLTEFWYRQKLFNDSLTIEFGRIPQGDFDGFSCDFTNLTFCGSPAGNTVGSYWYDWPIAQWAGWARYNFGEYDVSGGVYENNPQDLALQFSPGWSCCATGALGQFSLGWTPHFGPEGLVGHYRAGVWDDTAGGPDLLIGTNGKPFALTGLPPLHQPNSYGVYFMAEQQITGKAVWDRDSGWQDNSGLSVFFNFVQSDRATSALDNQVAAGLFYAGPFPTRPDDFIGVAVGRTDYNSRAAQAILLATPGVAVPHAEYPIEAFYSFQVNPWWDMRPDIQYVVHPGGYTNIANELLIGFRTDVKF